MPSKTAQRYAKSTPKAATVQQFERAVFLRKRGWAMTEVAENVGVSRQRIWQIAEALDRKQELKDAASALFDAAIASDEIGETYGIKKIVAVNTLGTTLHNTTFDYRCTLCQSTGTGTFGSIVKSDACVACNRKRRHDNMLKGMLGKKFGGWEVIRLDTNPTKQGNSSDRTRRYIVRCLHCNNEYSRQSYSIKHNKSGCNNCRLEQLRTIMQSEDHPLKS